MSTHIQDHPALRPYIEGEYDWSQETDVDGVVAAGDLLFKDTKRGIAELEGFAAKGSVAAMLWLGHFFAFSRYTTRDLTRAETWYRRALGGNSPYALYTVGVFFPLTSRYQEARSMYRAAADLGHGGALLRLAGLYASGKGGARDRAMAKRLFERARQDGNPLGEPLLGWLLIRDVAHPWNIPRGIWLFFSGIARLLRITREDPSSA
mgnify:CR=1 FL=1